MNQIQATLIYFRAMRKYNAQDWDAAIELWTRLLVSNRYKNLAYVNRGSTYSAQNDYAKAIADYSYVIDAKPQGFVLALAYNNRGYLYAVHGELEKSLPDCNHAIELAPKYKNTYGSRGHTYFLMERYADALADFQKSAKLKPKHKFALAGLALTYYKLGNLKKARQVWDWLMHMDKRYQEAETIKHEYHCASALVEEARKLIASLDT